jgi:hypothetical protein
MPERVQTHAGQLRLCRCANDGHAHLIHGVRLSIRLRKYVRRVSCRTCRCMIVAARVVSGIITVAFLAFTCWRGTTRTVP